MVYAVLSILLWVTTLLYGAAAGAYTLSYWRESPPFTTMRAPLLYAAVGTHFVFIGLWSAVQHRCMVTNVFEVSSLLAFVIAFIYAVLERVTRTKSSGFFILPIIFLLAFISATFLNVHGEPVSPVFLSVPMNIHVASALFGYAALALAGTYGGMYLMLYRSIRSNAFGTAFERLPSLAHLEQMSTVSVRFALAFLAVSIVIGATWLPAEVSAFSYADPKFIITIILWLVYFGGLVGRRFGRWQGKRLMEISVYGFIGALFSLTFINFFMSGFHRYF